ncbi:Lethal(2) giant larvae sro7 [Friedmanniomyces endolithicus]|nr:Lethal(2) giant larvae sro7 [Friedmanniomyces endolithicus]
MDVLISGPDRPPSQRMIAQQAAEAEEARRAGRAGASRQATAAANAAAGGGLSEEGYWAYMQRQVQERTEKLGLVGDSMENLEQNSASWAEEASKFVGRQKRGLVTGLVKAKFGL